MNNLILALVGWPEIVLILVLLLVMALMATAVALLLVRLLRRRDVKPEANLPSQGEAQASHKPPASCPRCGGALPAHSPQGLCPRCVLGVGLATQTEAPGESDPHGTKVLKPAPTPEDIARHFPQLEIMECLGRGGMGVVYKARQPKLNRLIALKILAPEKSADLKFSERFQREALALAKLNHPNIVTVHDFGEADGMFFLLMEFVDGVTLRQLLNTSRVAPREALAIVPQICDALQFAHDQGIVHRDIKPENILMDRRGRVKVADFGLAKIVGGNEPLTPALSPSDGERVAKPGEGTPVLTDAGKVMGTPNYMAPEQMERPDEVDHRADIYALGVVFYQMLTGELPGKHIEPPSKKVHIDVRLDEVVLRALEQKPELRYQQVSEVKTLVETIAGTTPSNPPAPDAVSSSSVDEKTRAEVLRQVKTPAIGLFAAGCLNLAMVVTVLFSKGIMTAETESFERTIVPQGLRIATQLISPVALVALIFIPGIIIVGASEMRRLAHHSLAFMASILAIILSPGSLIGLPFGIWSLVVLSRREVRDSFQSNHRRRSASLRNANGVNPAQPRWITAMRWAARILGTLCIVLILPFIFAEGLPPLAKQSAGVQLTFFGGFLLLLGFIIGWWREGRAAWLIAAGWTVIRISESDFRITTPFELVLLVAVLYALCWWATRGRKTAHAVAVVAVFAGLLALGRAYCPINVFVSGIVTDGATGKPIADARLVLPGETSLTADREERPNARTGMDGRFRLYVGWYAEGMQVLVAAPGYANQFAKLGPRLVGRRWLNQDFQSWQYPVGPREVELGRLGLRQNCCLDFETGRVLTPPPDLTQSYAAGNGTGATVGDTLRMHDWMRESGADIVLMPDGGLVLFDGLASHKLRGGIPSAQHSAMGRSQFDDVDVQREIMQTAALEKRMNQNRTQPPVPTMQDMQPLEQGSVWRFKTREGNTGLLEILDAGKDTDYLRLRYKLVQSTTSMSPPSNAASAAIPKEQGMSISFSNCPVSDALLNLAKELKLNCVLDPRIGEEAGFDPGRTVVNVNWTNITAAQAFTALLDNYRLQIITNAQTGVARIAAISGVAGKPAQPPGSRPAAVESTSTNARN